MMDAAMIGVDAKRSRFCLSCSSLAIALFISPMMRALPQLFGD